ncbi:MAG: efflux RND transporter periplasmic adaptor subunit [bacterium]
MFKKLFYPLLIILSFAVAGFLWNQQSQIKEVQQQQETYVCPMHAHITSHEHGQCPICGMNLVKKQIRKKVTTDQHRDHPIVQVNGHLSNQLSIKTNTVIRGTLLRNIETLGKITRLDPTARNIISTPLEGTIEYIANKHSGDMVRAGDLLFSIRSEKLKALEEEYFQAYQAANQKNTQRLIPLLRKSGLSPGQIEGLQSKTDFVPANVYAEEDGYIFIRRGKKGEQVRPGFTIFNIGGDYQLAEVTAEIFEREWGKIEEGQHATMTLRNIPGMVFEGHVSRVEPPVGFTTRSLEIKLKFKTNDPRLSQSMFAHISISGTPREGLLLIPSAALIRTEHENRVVKLVDDGSFQPVTVVAGEESMGQVEIISGLCEGDQVVSSGQFLIDSESQLSAAFQRMEQQQNND